MTATCPYIVTSDEGTSYCQLAETNSQPTPNPSQIRNTDHIGDTNKMVITPPPELVQQWISTFWSDGKPSLLGESDMDLAARAAQWGADQELEACCKWLNADPELVAELRADRRPKPPSLKEQALLQLDVLSADLSMHGKGCDLSQIRRALEQLDD